MYPSFLFGTDNDQKTDFQTRREHDFNNIIMLTRGDRDGYINGHSIHRPSYGSGPYHN